MAQNSFGTGSVSIGICDRCGLKYKYLMLRADGAKPGLRVCPTCYDKNHPIKVFKPKSDNFTLQFPRPDALLTNDYIGVVTPRGPLLVNNGEAPGVLITEDTNVEITATGYEQNTDLNDYIPPSLLDEI